MWNETYILSELASEEETEQEIEFIWDTVIEDILGEDKVTGVKLKNVKTGEISTKEIVAGNTGVTS